MSPYNLWLQQVMSPAQLWKLCKTPKYTEKLRISRYSQKPSEKPAICLLQHPQLDRMVPSSLYVARKTISLGLLRLRMFSFETTTLYIFETALERKNPLLNTLTNTTINWINIILISKPIMLPLQHSKPLDGVDEPQYVQHFLENPTKQKGKRRNSGYRKRSVRMHLQMSLTIYTFPWEPWYKTTSQW